VFEEEREARQQPLPNDIHTDHLRHRIVPQENPSRRALRPTLRVRIDAVGVLGSVGEDGVDTVAHHAHDGVEQAQP